MKLAHWGAFSLNWNKEDMVHRLEKKENTGPNGFHSRSQMELFFFFFFKANAT